MDKKISQLTAATTPLTGAEELAIVQSGVTKKATIEDVKGYKVYTALLTQSGGDDPLNINSGSLTIGVTYEIYSPSTGMDFTNVGAPDNNLGTKFVATGTTPNSWGINEGSPGIPILAYNSGAPVVTVLENTIGNIWFTYNSVGNYDIWSNDLFTANKTTFFINLMTDDISSGNLCVGYMQEPNYLGIVTSGDGALTFSTPIEIRVYN